LPLIVFLRGVNVGGHRTFQPSVLAKQLSDLDVVNIGAAGTFVVRKPISQSKLRAEILKRLPFEPDIMICSARDVLRLASRDPFASAPSDKDVVRFVSVLAKRPRELPPLPLGLPSDDGWLLKIIAVQDRFVLGLYRRQMKAIGYLGQIDKRLGVRATTRNWNTITAIVKILKSGRPNSDRSE
jgi:uncharacterized protein (DUF1697 family)